MHSSVDKSMGSTVNVKKIYYECLFNAYEDLAEPVVFSGPTIEGVRFDQERLSSRDSVIVGYLASVVEVDDRSNRGLIELRNLSYIKGGRRWAGLDMYAEFLLILGMALGRVEKEEVGVDSMLEAPVYVVNLA